MTVPAGAQQGTTMPPNEAEWRRHEPPPAEFEVLPGHQTPWSGTPLSLLITCHGPSASAVVASCLQS